MRELRSQLIISRPIWQRPGGLYGVTTVKGGVEAISPAWKRFSQWVKDSKYEFGDHQWLEEHLGFDDDFNHGGNIDLFLPLKQV